MSEVNAGFAIVNDAPIDPDEKMAYCVLGMPREPSGDKGVPFRDVPRGPKRG